MNEPSQSLSKLEYLQKFPDIGGADCPRKEAFKCALDIRKFEIELYWKRATYFWTIIGAALIGYAALQAREEANERKDSLSVMLSCLGFVFSTAWFLVNKGSKKWQENWERNVKLLEHDFVGPLFETVWDKKPSGTREWIKHTLSGSGRFSGSRINQIVSLFVVALWIILWCSAQSFSLESDIDYPGAAASAGAIFACAAFGLVGRSVGKSYHAPDGE